MRRRQTLPRLWLITDPRGGDPVAALRRMPRGSGVVFRHFELGAEARWRLFNLVRAEARWRGGTVLWAEKPRDGAAWRAADPDSGLFSTTVHDRRELIAAQRAGADLVFVSPIFPTRTHPGARSIGVVRLGLMLRGNRTPAFALGGMNSRKFRKLNGLSLHGWAAIDAFRI
jgi:thiamine-phosphate pyrophosphorylase